jgi:hypothetical protein
MLSRVVDSSRILFDRFRVAAPKRIVRDLSANPRVRLGLSVFAGAVFASAAVLAQVAKTEGMSRKNTTATTVQKKAAQMPDQKQSGFIKLPGKAAMGPADAAAARATAVARQRQNQIRQYMNMGRPYVRAELIFVRHLCPMSQELLRQLSREAELVLTDVVTKMIDAVQQSRRTPRGARLAAATPEYGRLLQDGLAGMFKKRLTSEQWSRYEAERDKRRASRKAAAVGFLVDAIDRELYLSPAQRTRLIESLSDPWDDGWEIYLDYQLLGNRFYPMGIDQYVSPCLSDVQKATWQGFQRAVLNSPFGGNLGQFAQDPDALEEERGEERKADGRNAEEARRMMIEAEMADLEMQRREIEVRQPLLIQKAEMKKFESKKAEMKKAAGK